MMTPANIDLTIYQGATFGKVFAWKTNGALVDLTGYTARMAIKKKVFDTDDIILLTTENGGIALGGVLGTITLSISAGDTAAMDFVDGVYDIELIAPVTGLVTRILMGAATLSLEVTR